MKLSQKIHWYDLIRHILTVLKLYDREVILEPDNEKKSIDEKCLSDSISDLLKWLVENFPEVKTAMKNCVLNIVDKEAQHICKKSFDSEFNFKGFEPIIDYDKMKHELTKITP